MVNFYATWLFPIKYLGKEDSIRLSKTIFAFYSKLKQTAPKGHWSHRLELF